MKPSQPVEFYLAANGAQIYRIAVEAFTDFYAWVYLVLSDGVITLLDTGSSYPCSIRDLLHGFDIIREQFGVPVSPADIDTILITHGHIDHYGGLNALLPHAPQARIAVHELDLRVLTNHNERVVMISKRLDHFLCQAGVSTASRPKLMQMYLMYKAFFRSVAVHDVITQDATLPGGLQVYHVPGHCSGMLVTRVGDVLLAADQVSPRITPHQAPESIASYTGLGHYFESLRKVKAIPNIRLALGGHEVPMPDLYARVAEIEQSHQYRLSRTLDICAAADAAGLTISDISRELFNGLSGYNVLLGLEEAGAHVEYLYQRGLLAVANLDELEKTENPAIYYKRV